MAIGNVMSRVTTNSFSKHFCKDLPVSKYLPKIMIVCPVSADRLSISIVKLPHKIFS